MSLEPIEPAKAVELYLADRENEVSKATIDSHRSRLGHLVRWCDEQDITNLNELTGRDLHEYRLWRRNEGDLAPASEKTQMDTIRVFIRWVESIDGVEQDLHTKVRSPTLSGDDNIRDVMLEPERAERILEYLRTYEYASRPHVTLALMWHTMMRVGAVCALDLSDYDPTDQAIQVIHRPETDTPIKNAERGERFVALSEDLCDLLDDWIADQRPEVIDDHGREPLITTNRGRAHINTLRRDCYRYTRPCVVSGECPHDRDVEECEATEHDHAPKCPSSVSSHALRRGGITYALSKDWPAHAVSGRADVSQSVLRDHYDQVSDKTKMEKRRQYLDNI